MEASTFLLQCLKQDLKSSPQIIDAANSAIQINDAKIKKIENEAAELRAEKSIYYQIIKSFNAETERQAKPAMVMSDLDSLDELNPEQAKLVNQALKWLENEWNNNRQVLPTDLMKGLEINTDNDIVAYSLIKWMGVQSLIRRQDGAIIKGAKWKLEVNETKSQ